LTTFAIIYNSISFYFGFGEKLTILKLFGMTIIISCVVCLALDSVNRQPDATDEGLVTDKNYALLGLGVGMIVPM
jgi:drug/metabolite transporter (DMT)-like permease